MTEKNTAIEIMQVGNGFIVKPPRDISRQYDGAILTEMMVFQSMAALTDHLEKHFDHRSHNVQKDAKP